MRVLGPPGQPRFCAAWLAPFGSVTRAIVSGPGASNGGAGRRYLAVHQGFSEGRLTTHSRLWVRGWQPRARSWLVATGPGGVAARERRIALSAEAERSDGSRSCLLGIHVRDTNDPDIGSGNPQETLPSGGLSENPSRSAGELRRLTRWRADALAATDLASGRWLWPWLATHKLHTGGLRCPIHGR